MHHWTDEDNIIAYYLYRSPHHRNSHSVEIIAERLGMSKGSLSFKIGNFEYLDTNGVSGLSGYSMQAEEVYKQFKDMPDDEYESLASRLLSEKDIDISQLNKDASGESVEEAERKVRRLQAQLDHLKQVLKKSRR